MLVNGCGCSLAGPSPAAPGTVPTRHCHTQHSAPASSTPGTLTLITQRTHTHSLGALILIIRHPHTQHSVHSSSAPGTLILNTRSPQPPLLSLASCLPCRLSCPPLVNQVSHLHLWSLWPRNHSQPSPHPWMPCPPRPWCSGVQLAPVVPLAPEPQPPFSSPLDALPPGLASVTTCVLQQLSAARLQGGVADQLASLAVGRGVGLEGQGCLGLGGWPYVS